MFAVVVVVVVGKDLIHVFDDWMGIYYIIIIIIHSFIHAFVRYLFMFVSILYWKGREIVNMQRDQEFERNFYWSLFNNQ